MTDSNPTTSDIRFAPNFSVHILPPDVVCLYSEDRKIFLRGELYVALAERIGAGERQEDAARALSEKFPAEKIDEAFKRLFERRYVVRPAAADGPAAAYWASLGLGLQTAADNLAKVRVRVLSMGGAGEAELTSALRSFGVRVDDDEADLTIVLVGDYLDPKLAEFNARQLAQKQEWLPVQPSGIFPLVGPIFSPGKSACWHCLAERLQRNRQIKEFLDRKQARCVATSPLDGEVLAQSAIGLAAVEIAKAIASSFRTELHRQLVSLELLGSTVARHTVTRRPQCPACGSAELRDPARVPAPTRLRVGGKSVMTSGGWRALPPAETLNRFRKHVSPLTGVVSKLERTGGELSPDTSFVARHPFAPRPETVEALQAGLAASFGTGSTSEQAEASALMKAIERTSGVFQGDEIRARRAFADFPAGTAIAPNEIMLLSDGQLAHGAAPRFDPSAAIDWSPVWSLRDECFRHLPTGLLYYFHADASHHPLRAEADGCAAGNTNEEAILQAFLELVGRDAQAIWWYNRLPRPEVDLDKLGDSHIRDQRAAFAATGRRLWMLDITSDLGIPVYVAVLHWIEDGHERIGFAMGAHFDSRIAALRAVTGLNLQLAIDRAKRRGAGPAGDDPLPLRSHTWLQPHGKARATRNPFAKFADLERRDQVHACVKLAARHKLDFLVLDQTRPDIEVPVVRVIVPGLRPPHRRLATGRLYDVPLALGLRKRRLKEADLNPLDPRG